MQLACRHCGVTNEIGPFEVDAACRACRRPLFDEASGAPPGRPAEGDLFDLSELAGSADGLGGTQPTPLGDMPRAADAGYDLSALLDPVGPSAVPGGSVDDGPGFAFDDGLAGAVRADEAGGWRVKSERGLVYELMTLDAVVAWLEGKDDVEGVRVARGAGAFLPVRDVPELSKRLGLSAAGAVGPRPDEAPLQLDTDPRPKRQGTASAKAGTAPARTPARSREVAAPRAGARPARVEQRPSLGLGFVLWLLLGGGLLAGGGVAVGLKTGFMSLPPEPAKEAAPHTPDEQVRAAIAALEAGQNTGAAQLLRQAAEAEGAHPSVFRHLAVALHRTGSDDEAREALAEYRRRMARMGR